MSLSGTAVRSLMALWMMGCAFGGGGAPSPRPSPPGEGALPLTPTLFLGEREVCPRTHSGGITAPSTAARAWTCESVSRLPFLSVM